MVHVRYKHFIHKFSYPKLQSLCILQGGGAQSDKGYFKRKEGTLK
jgi:hypothetical protein